LSATCTHSSGPGGTGVGADAIAAQQLHALKQYYKRKLRLTDVKAMFLELKDHA
jgi:hypothetical protein